MIALNKITGNWIEKASRENRKADKILVEKGSSGTCSA